MILLAASLVLMMLGSLMISLNLAFSRADRYWILLAGVSCQLGFISTALSIVRALSPVPFLCLQLFITGLLTASLALGKRLNPINQAYHALRKDWEGAEAFLREIDSVSIVFLLLITVLVLLSATYHLFSPVHFPDELGYQTSRAIHWIQNHSIFHFPTPDYRQTAFTIGSSLFFFWPVLFTKIELLGREMFFLCYPLVLLGSYSIMRELGVSRRIALGGTLVLAATPIVAFASFGQRSDLWTATFVLGATHWSMKIWRRAGFEIQDFFALGMFALLSVNSKFIAIPILIVSLLLPIIKLSGGLKWKGLRRTIAGVAFASLFSGFGMTIGFNLAMYGHWAGPEPFRKVAQADLGVRQSYTHLVRTGLTLLELPEVPTPEVRTGLASFGNRILTLFHANLPLPGESPGHSPAPFRYDPQEYARFFSLPGLLWIPMLVVSGVGVLRRVRSRQPDPVFGLLLMEIPLFAAIVLTLRWQADSQVPERFLILPYTLSVIRGSLLLNEWTPRMRLSKALVLVLIAATVYPSARTQVVGLSSWIREPTAPAWIEEPHREALAHLPCGSRILLIAGYGALDYPLFRPGQGYCNKVFRWQGSVIDTGEILRMVKEDSISHIILENDHWLYTYEHPVLASQAAVWLQRQSWLKELPLTRPYMRLFETRSSAEDLRGRPR